jgi:hypothetical protein
MPTRNRRDDWLDENEYPDDRDVDDLGDDSPYDNDPLSIGRVPGLHQSFWTRTRILVALLLGLMLLVFILPRLLSLLSG